MGLGDQIAQNFIDNSKTIDFVRTMQFTGIGLFISVSNYKYYIIFKLKCFHLQFDIILIKSII